MSHSIVFIIGAGASEEAKLPTSNELKQRVSQLLDFKFNGFEQTSGDHAIVEALRLHVRQPDGRHGHINPYIREARKIKDAVDLAISIDNFIDAHRDNNELAFCAKLAIERSILDAERRSLLYFDQSRADATINFDALKNTWYIPFFQLLTENCALNELQERLEKITLVVFNYDRCIEHFLYHALKNYYTLSTEEAAKLVNVINIYHPYGEVGVLPWQASESLEFGTRPETHQLLQLSQRIRTFTEGANPESSEILEIRKKVGEANKIVFMGFAFHKLNMHLISPAGTEFNTGLPKQCLATTFGVSKSDTEVVITQIREKFIPAGFVKTENLKCGAFLYHFWRSLAF